MRGGCRKHSSIMPGQRSPILRRLPFPPARTTQVDENHPISGRSPLENALRKTEQFSSWPSKHLRLPDVNNLCLRRKCPRSEMKPPKAHLNSSSWLPVRSKKATLSFDDQITSQSPEFATWYPLLPESRCILCRRLRISMGSGEFSRIRSIRLRRSTRSQLRRWAFFSRSLENAAENSAVNLPHQRIAAAIRSAPLS